MPINQRTYRGLAWLAVAVGAIEFVARALLRIRIDWLSDLAAPYTSTRLWMGGANPYSPHDLLAAWFASGASAVGLTDGVSGTHSVYPPPTLLVMTPFALLYWADAVHLFVILGLLLYGTSVLSLIRLGWPGHKTFGDFARDPSAVLFAAFSLGFAPVHTAFSSQNIVLIATCAAILSATLLFKAKPDGRGRARSVVVTIAIAAAICFKPTTGIFLLPWLLVERRWRLFAAVLGACGTITAVSLVPLLSQHDLSWLAGYRENVTALFAHGGNADVSSENIFNTDRIDLQLVLFAISGNRTISSVAAAGVYALLLGAFVLATGWRERLSGSRPASKAHDLPLLIAGGSLALGLLPIYARVYSAVALLPLVLWCFGHLRFSSARWLLVLLSDFLVNSSVIARRLGELLRLPSPSPRAWDATVGGHTCWLLLAVGFLLIYAARQQRQELSSQPL